MRIATFIRKALGLKAHRVVRVEEDEAAKTLIVHLDRREHRRLRCGECGRTAWRVAPARRPARRWRDLAMREHILELVYAPCRVWCAPCGLRVERIPWADKWQRVTHALARGVAGRRPQLNSAAVGPPLPPATHTHSPPSAMAAPSVVSARPRAHPHRIRVPNYTH